MLVVDTYAHPIFIRLSGLHQQLISWADPTNPSTSAEKEQQKVPPKPANLVAVPATRVQNFVSRKRTNKPKGGKRVAKKISFVVYYTYTYIGGLACPTVFYYERNSPLLCGPQQSVCRWHSSTEAGERKSVCVRTKRGFLQRRRREKKHCRGKRERDRAAKKVVGR